MNGTIKLKKWLSVLISPTLSSIGNNLTKLVNYKSFITSMTAKNYSKRRYWKNSVLENRHNMQSVRMRSIKKKKRRLEKSGRKKTCLK